MKKIILLIGVVAFLFISCSKFNNNELKAYNEAKKNILLSLKSPSSAKFTDENEITISKNGDRYIVQGFVDAQNSYGAALRSKYKATISMIGDLYLIDELIIGDETVFKLR